MSKKKKKNNKKGEYVFIIIVSLILIGMFFNSDDTPTKQPTVQTYNNNAGYSQKEAQWLRNKGVTPQEARELEELCGVACQ